jgi:hypothetical protein
VKTGIMNSIPIEFTSDKTIISGISNPSLNSALYTRKEAMKNIVPIEIRLIRSMFLGLDF